MNTNSMITVDVKSHLVDCPPNDEGIDEELLLAVLKLVMLRFDYTPIYDAIDQIAAQALRELQPKRRSARLNWKPPVMTLLYQLQRQGCTLVAVDDGVHRHAIDTNASAARQRAAAADAITAVDACYLIVRHPDDIWTGTLYLVLGNDADEIPADWSTRLPLASNLDAAVNAYQAIWGGKAVPTKPVENQ